MTEVILTSSILILAVIALRHLLRGKVSQKLIYAAWLLVALRLLVPLQFGSFSFSMLTPAQPITDAISDAVAEPLPGPAREEAYRDAITDRIDGGYTIFIPSVQQEVEQALQEGSSPQEVYDRILDAHPGESILLPEAQDQIRLSLDLPTIGSIMTAIWLCGTAVMMIWFIFVNCTFHRQRRDAVPQEEMTCPIPVLLDRKLLSPCLFGFVRPRIYLTDGCSINLQTRSHVLAHELTHYRHLDHIWSLVRCLCLCIYWFNPLVWVAAELSRRDSELACDEGAIAALGEDQRIPYGKTLLNMVEQGLAPSRFMETATAMHETREQLTDRIKRIARKPHFALTAAIVLVLVLALVAGCAFAGVRGTDTAVLEQEMEALYRETVLETHNRDTELEVHYQATFGDVHVALIHYDVQLAVTGGEFIAGIRFEYPTIQYMYAYHEGRLMRLQEAYEQGLVTYQDIEILSETYQYAYLRTPEKEQLYLELLIGKIRQDYWDTMLRSSDKHGHTIDDLTVTVCGSFGEVHVVYVEDMLLYPTVLSEETVAGITFHYPTPKTMYAYHNGTFLRLQEAYDRGLLTKEDLTELKENYPFTDLSVSITPTDPPMEPPTDPPTESALPTWEETMLAIPAVPAAPETIVKLDSPTLDTLVHPVYAADITWTDNLGNENFLPVRVPAIAPISADAVVINNAIRETAEEILASERLRYSQGASTTREGLGYTAYLRDNILSVILTDHSMGSADPSYVFCLDVSTGEYLSTPDLAHRYLDMDYAEFATTAMVFVLEEFERQFGQYKDAAPDDYFRLVDAIPTDSLFMSSLQLYMDETRGLTLHYDMPTIASPSYNTITVDPEIWKAARLGADESWNRIFATVHTGHYGYDTVYKQYVSAVMREAFLGESEEFLSRLHGVNADDHFTIISYLSAALSGPEQDYAIKVCQSIVPGSAAYLSAQLLLDALGMNSPR